VTTPVRGVLLSTAELDHVLGLPLLREAAELAVYASGTVLAALAPVRSVLAAYADVRWHRLDAGEPVGLAGGLWVRRWTIGSKRPRYARAGSDHEWVSALDIVDSRGARLLYATCFAEWTPALAGLVDAADCAVLDGTFHTAAELERVTGHLPVEHSLAAVHGRKTRIFYSPPEQHEPAGGGRPPSA
jgi:pyrroloquinoline quinone biosynthesis protein B